MIPKKPTPKTNDTAHMSFGVPVELRNAFKAKVASQGKKVGTVLVALIEEYVKAKKQ